MPRRKSRKPRPAPPVVSSATGTLKVIGGTLRGRPIEYLGDPRTRPMKQRVREAAFNLLGPRVRDTHVIDLFAGTGALSWEALSRGAASATLIEKHFPSARMIRANASALQVLERIEVLAGDAFYWARQLERRRVTPVTDRPWLVFCSPPYDLYVTMTRPMVELVQQLLDAAPPRSSLVVEADGGFDMALLPSELVWDCRAYPPAVLAVATKHEDFDPPAK